MIDVNYVKEYIRKQPVQSKIYLGCDSEIRTVKSVNLINYYRVVVIHHNGCNGCKIFGEKIQERAFDRNKRNPKLRLMQEVYKVSELFLLLADCFDQREVEVHLDLNSSVKFISSSIVDQAIGYIKGTCNVIPQIKPNSWAASSVADKMLKQYG